MGVKDHTPGQVRYLTYILEFPGDSDFWIDQIPFVNELDFFLKQTRYATYDPGVYRDLLVKGEASFYDKNHVKHVLKIEEIERPKKWGKNKDSGASRVIAGTK